MVPHRQCHLVELPNMLIQCSAKWSSSSVVVVFVATVARWAIMAHYGTDGIVMLATNLSSCLRNSFQWLVACPSIAPVCCVCLLSGMRPPDRRGRTSAKTLCLDSIIAQGNGSLPLNSKITLRKYSGWVTGKGFHCLFDIYLSAYRCTLCCTWRWSFVESSTPPAWTVCCKCSTSRSE